MKNISWQWYEVYRMAMAWIVFTITAFDMCTFAEVEENKSTVVFKIIQPPLKLIVLASLTLILIIQSSCLQLNQRGTCRSDKYNITFIMK